MPEEWKNGVIVPVYKKGNKKKVENYRGIALIDMACKIYAEVLRNRLDKEMEEKGIFSDTQMRFRKGRETMKAIYIVKKAMGKKLRAKKGKL